MRKKLPGWYSMPTARGNFIDTADIYFRGAQGESERLVGKPSFRKAFYSQSFFFKYSFILNTQKYGNV